MKKKSKKQPSNDDFIEEVEVVVEKEVKEVKREWREFIKFGDENRLLFAAFVVVMTAIVIVNTIYVVSNNNNNHRPSIAAAATIPNPNKVLTTMQTGLTPAQQVQVSAVNENDKTDYAFTISPNDTMLIMNVTITNLTNLNQFLIPVHQFYVRSKDGDYASLHASMYVTNPLVYAEIKPGQTVTGQLSFDVPKRVDRPLLYVDTGWGNYAPLVFDVLH